jgi:3',5'-cyclic AMP phosphodiesterase CpdA
MTSIVHISDLHFGRDNEELTGPLADAVNAIGPDVVAVSGDLTQRARRSQFARARAFLDRIAAPKLVVPGNHDVPLDNIFVRFLRPFSRYREAICRELEPQWNDAHSSIVGINSVNPYAWQSGILRPRTVRKVCDALDHPVPGRRRVIVLHHPLTLPPGATKRSMRGAKAAKAKLAACGADLILCGHLHGWRAERIRDPDSGFEALLVQAGTGLSTRLRGEHNDFNQIELEPGALTVTRHVAEDGRVFRPGRAHRFARVGHAWRPG